MPSKRSKAQNGDAGGQKISSFFKPDGKSLTSAGIKRSREEECMSFSPPPAKRASISPPGGQENNFSPPPTEMSSDSSPNSQENGLSPEQKSRMERNRLEAEAKVIAKKFGTKEMGLSWVKALLPEFKKPYMQELIRFVSEQRSKYTVYPPVNDVFTWTTACPVNEVKVVILGQDPYHGPNQAHGLCFSVRVGISIPPSLQNMYKELSSDIEGFKLPDHGYLMGWAKQGVLLLNACLTVRAREPNSHAGKGWENLTDAVIHWLNDKRSGMVFLLWGSYAQKKGSFINKKKHCVLRSPHPSPLSAHRGFLGNKHFSQTNAYLMQHGKKPIDWSYLPKTLDV